MGGPASLFMLLPHNGANPPSGTFLNSFCSMHHCNHVAQIYNRNSSTQNLFKHLFRGLTTVCVIIFLLT